MSKKVLHIINSLEIGGAEKLLVTLINNLPSNYEQHLILLSSNNTLINEISTSCKITVINVRMPFQLFKAVVLVKNYCKKNSIDIIHTQLYWPGIIARLAANSKLKVINCIQAISSDSTYKISKIAYYLEKITYKKKHIIIAVSKCVLQDFDEWIGIKGKSYVFYNLISREFFELEPKNIATIKNLKLIAVGNLRWQKNYEYLLDAFRFIKDKSVSLDIFGEGNLRNKFENQIKDECLNIKLKGHSHNIEDELVKYNFFVMSSLYEGFSLALMEAMASGLIPLLSNIPVLKEAGEESAIYFELNDPQSFVRVIKNIQEGRYNLEQLSHNAKKRAFLLCNTDNYISSISEIYDN